MKDPRDLKKGDLCVFAIGTYSYPVIFHSLSADKSGDIKAVRGFSIRRFPDKVTISTRLLCRVQGFIDRKVWKITEDNLTDEESANYKKWKAAYDEFSL